VVNHLIAGIAIDQLLTNYLTTVVTSFAREQMQ